MHCADTGLIVITEYAMGLIMPGYPVANVCFKVYGYMSMSQAVAFLSDFKLGHYMKIPPKSMFLVQEINESPQHIVLLSELLTCIKETKVTNYCQYQWF